MINVIPWPCSRTVSIYMRILRYIVTVIISCELRSTLINWFYLLPHSSSALWDHHLYLCVERTFGFGSSRAGWMTPEGLLALWHKGLDINSYRQVNRPAYYDHIRHGCFVLCFIIILARWADHRAIWNKKKWNLNQASAPHKSHPSNNHETLSHTRNILRPVFYVGYHLRIKIVT